MKFVILQKLHLLPWKKNNHLEKLFDSFEEQKKK